MIRIIFIIILFLSSNVFAATYLICKTTDNTQFKTISVKLDKKKIFININNKGLVDWSEHITKINKEEIIVHRKWGKRTANFSCKEELESIFPTKYECKKDSANNYFVEEEANRILKELPPNYEEFKFDRISGLMNYNSKSYNIKPSKFVLFGVTKSTSSSNYMYTCKVEDKTLF